MIGSSATMKSLGKCSALNAHAAFDVAVDGNMVGNKPMRHLPTLPERGLGRNSPCLLDNVLSVHWPGNVRTLCSSEVERWSVCRLHTIRSYRPAGCKASLYCNI